MTEARVGEKVEHATRGTILIRVDLPESDELYAYGITQEAESLVYEATGLNFTYGFSVVSMEGPDEPTKCYRCGCEYHPCEDCDHRLCATPNPDGPTLRWAPTMKPIREAREG